ncbi:MAG: ribonuclease HI, partial [Lachnospiraceae bacterium]|nr:ribonuclease HI [Lachnospiraceae bacterium]
GYKKTTNNRMELMGVIAGLESLNRPCDVEIVSDSKYVTDAFNQDWIGSWIKNGWKKSDKKPVLNTDLWKRLLEAKAPHNVTFTWVKGHNDHPENERCDKMAVEAALSSELLDDVAE